MFYPLVSCKLQLLRSNEFQAKTLTLKKRQKTRFSVLTDTRMWLWQEVKTIARDK
jgi:hypothetical protein